MQDVTITGLSRIRNPKPNKGGSTVLAHFDCEARGFAFMGCAFVRTPKNGLVVWLPKIEGPESTRRSISFTDDSIRHEMMLQARETYRALGGTDAEWIGRSVPMGPRTDWGTDLEIGGIMHAPAQRPSAVADVEPGEEASGLSRFIGEKGE